MRHNLTICLLLVLLLSHTLAAQAPDEAKPSSYAPAADLVRQVNTYVESLTAATADAEDYNEDKQAEVLRDANTLASIALVLGMHDQENALKPAAAKLMAASKQVAAEHGDAEKAAAAVKALRVIVDKPEKGEAIKWQPSGEMVALMKQVPIVNNNLRRGVDGRRFTQSADKNAALAATLAAIAQAAMLDTDYVSDESDRPQWINASKAMRDGSAEALAAIRKNDQAAAKAAMDKIVKSCDDCHHKFRN
jgi:cytochrome c556